MTKVDQTFIGMDVGKTWLDIAIYDRDEVMRVHNDETGIAELLTKLVEQNPALIVVEATGGYEQSAVQTLILHQYRVAVVNPTRVRALAKATGKLAKTDAIDAHLIAEYAFKIRPEPTSFKEERELQLRALVSRREQLVEIATAEQNRLGTAYEGMKADIREHLVWLHSQISILDEEIKQLIDSFPEWKEAADRLDSIPGVGFVTAVTVLAEMPELGKLDRQKIAALAGLAPFNQDSGKRRGKRRIFGGRKGIRRVLYMACVSAIRFNPVIRDLYQRLTEKGKVFKVVITACMRKLLTIMNAMSKNKSAWKPPVLIAV